MTARAEDDSRTRSWGGGGFDRRGVPYDLPARWRFSRVLGSGGQAEVCLAHDRELDVWVAIKVFRAELEGVERERLRREVRLGRELQHPGLVRVHELVEVGDRLGVVMEWVSGGSLSKRAAGSPMAIDAVEDVARQTLEVLAYLHEQRIVHRDIKPSNLLIDDEGRVRLADLGLARPVDGGDHVTRSHFAVGTPAYMAPEQIRGMLPTPASDLYALGATLYRLLTGEAPFKGDTDLDVAARHLMRRAPDPRRLRPDCPRWFAHFVLRLMERDAGDRWPDAGAALTAYRRRRGLVSPRLLRRSVVLAAAAVVVFILVWVAVTTVRDTPVAAARLDGDEVVAVNVGGRELWRRSVLGTSQRILVEDVTGDGLPEVITGGNDDVDDGIGTTNLVVLSARGSELANVTISTALIEDYYPSFLPRFRGVHLATADADGDGLAEIVWFAPHYSWYPAVLGLWTNSWPERTQPLLINSGHITSVIAADLDGDGGDELVVVAINNLMGYQAIVAVVDLAYAPEKPFLAVANSPDLLLKWHYNRTITSSGTSLRSYTPLGPVARVLTVVEAGPDGIVVQDRDHRIELDVFGNPRRGALEGSDALPRNLFWDALVQLCTEIEAGREDVAPAVDELIAEHRHVWEEAPSRLATAMLVSRSLARSGRYEEAVSMLAAIDEDLKGTTDVWLRRAEYLAAAGRLDEARVAVRQGLQGPGSGRDLSDAVVLVARTACLDGGGQREFRLADEYTRYTELLTEDLGALSAFCRGDWSSPFLDEGDSGRIVPEAEVLRRWAEFVRHGSSPELFEEIRPLASNPELRNLAQLLEATVLLVQGEVERAGSLARLARSELEQKGRTAFERAMWLPLAEHVLAEVAKASGQAEQAAAHAERAAAAAPQAWFGGAAP